MAVEWDQCEDCGEMLCACVCEYLPRDSWDLEAEEDFLEDPEPYATGEIPGHVWDAQLEEEERERQNNFF
jgi:hypothetical protein